MGLKLSMDRWMAGTVLFLTFFGLTMVFSASAMVSDRSWGTFTGFLIKQALATVLGLALLVAATRFDYQRLRNPLLIWSLLLGCLYLLILVRTVGNSRWLVLGGLSFQPSELTKLVLLIYLADLLARKEDRLGEWRGFLLPCLALLGLFCMLIYTQPDLGTTVTVALIAFCLFFLAGMPWRRLAALAAGGTATFVLLASRSEYTWRRVMGFLYPHADPLGNNFQMNQSLIAVGAGGITGVGLGKSTQKLLFLPAAHTDFIFAIIGEELGFLGCLVLLGAFLVLFWRGIRTALRARDRFGAYLVAGITLSLVIQALINMGVVLGMLPTKGLPLPFVSYGGSSLLISLLAAGLALNVSQHVN
ncbi:MAG: putative lipid II flippase FtsW [Acidobacteriota bacterium]